MTSSPQQRYLTEQASEVRHRATRLKKIDQVADQRELYREQLRELYPLALRFQTVTSTRNAFADRGILIQDLQSASATRRDFEQIAEAFREDPDSLITPQNARQRKEVFIRVEAVVERQEQKVLEDWRRYVQDLLPPVNDEVLELLASVSSYADTIRRVRRALRSLKEAAEQRPSEIEQIEAVIHWASEIKGAWQELGGGDIPESVLKLLREAGDEGADISLLTSDVVSWLKERNLIGAFVVHMR